jgi:ribosomal protein S18 acetylase RimI-like enzyme
VRAGADATLARVTPITAADFVGAAAVAERTLPVSPGSTELRAARRERLRLRVETAVESDPEGAWVAREDERVVGMSLAVRSDGIWVLSLLAVDPDAQSGGLGRSLLEHSLRYAEGCRGAMISSSDDPRAMRIYARAGFDLRPAIAAHGEVDRSAIPAGLPVREGTLDDVGRTAPIDAAVRGGIRPHHIAQMVAGPSRLYLADGDRGYAVGDGRGRVIIVAATDEEAAQALLWRLLADAEPDDEAIVERVTGGQDWAVDVLLRAGLALRPDAPVFTRGRLGPLAPFIPSGAYL